MPNRLGLKDWRVTEVEESTTDMRITAQYTPLPTVCPRCGVSDPPLYKHDIRTQEFMDTPIHGKRVHLIVKRQRYSCQSCQQTFQQLLPDMDEKRIMTKRLAEYIRRLSLEKKFTEIADEVGVNEKTVRNIFREHVDSLDAERRITALALKIKFPKAERFYTPDEEAKRHGEKPPKRKATKKRHGK